MSWYSCLILYCTLCLCLVSFDIPKSGCFGHDLEVDLTSKSGIGTMDINIIKEKAKDIPRPEDVPQVSEWIKECKKTVGNRKWRVIRKSPNRMVDCISKYINFNKLELEVKDSMERGELDLVFKKYCGLREQIMECIDDVLEMVKLCLTDQQVADLDIALNAVDAGIDFTCYENGDRIALFMAENGVECLTNTSSTIMECIDSKLPELKKVDDDPESIKLDQFHFNDKNCKKMSVAHQCVVTATTTCDDPTPSNILDSLITQSLKVTPCAQTSTISVSASNGFYLHFWALLPHVLTLIFAGLTAAHILL